MRKYEPVSVQTVTGPVLSSELGICLTHEHVLNDVRSWWAPTTLSGIDPVEYRDSKVSTNILWELRNDPFGNLDNCFMDQLDEAVSEVSMFGSLGGHSIVEATSISIGRDLPGLKHVSEATGVNIIAGTGFYLDSSQPEHIKTRSAEELATIMLKDLEGNEGGIKPGIIGEVGVSSDFTQAERKSLTAACQVQLKTHLPMQIHLPGWFRLGHTVLDLVESVGVDPRFVTLCHMGPSGSDFTYQSELAKRGAFIQYDMIGMEVFYADQGVQCPSDDDNARYLMKLVEAGFADNLLISQDVFLKSLLRRNGGPGYAHILQFFVPRLKRHGANNDLIAQLIQVNPRRMFEIPKENHVN